MCKRNNGDRFETWGRDWLPQSFKKGGGMVGTKDLTLFEKQLSAEWAI